MTTKKQTDGLSSIAIQMVHECLSLDRARPKVRA
jgi:hypothetical protein